MTTGDSSPSAPSQPGGITDRHAAIAKLACDTYLTSGDFNGLPVRTLESDASLIDDVRLLIQARAIDLVRGDRHGNPHIKALAVDPVDEQLSKIDQDGLGHGCLYPTPDLLANRVNPNDYVGRPYTLELALGACQLDFRPFDMASLELYRNDPRYRYDVNDIQGSIVYREEYLGTGLDPLVLRFGFCHSQPELRRAVAVLLRYLNKLEPDQQQHWLRHQRAGEFRLHPGFENAINGGWKLGLSIFDAFLEEKNQINIMSGLMGRAPLFRTAKPEKRPVGFGFLIRPTQRELRAFTLQLDHFLGDDLNPEFFTELDKVVRGKSDGGQVMVQPKGSISLLQEWLDQAVRLDDPTVSADVIKNMKRIRKLRQKPAHRHEEDVFDERFLDEQRELILAAYAAVHNLRLIFQLHPATKAHTVPSRLLTEHIWTR